jgi:hypothetical protein
MRGKNGSKHHQLTDSHTSWASALVECLSVLGEASPIVTDTLEVSIVSHKALNMLILSLCIS